MFGKRKQDHKHRYADEVVAGDPPDGDPRPGPDDEGPDDQDLAEALLQLGRNQRAPLREPQPDESSELDEPSEPDVPSEPDAPSEPLDQKDRDESDVPDRPARALVPTAAMLAEPEPEPEPEPEAVETDPTSGAFATYAAPERERIRGADQNAAANAKDESASLKAESKALRTGTSATGGADLPAATARADELEQALRESQARIEELTGELERARSDSPAAADDAGRAAAERVEAAEKSAEEWRSRVSALKADLELARSEAAAAGVALERVEREAKHQEETVAAAEERAEQLAAEIEQLRAAAAAGPAQVERLHREAERERTLREAMDQAQKSHAQAETALADNLRLAGQLAANIQSQEGLIAALTGLQAEITEQRAWFEAQIANVGETERQQTSVIESLQATIQDRDAELEMLRQHLLEAEAKRAEEAAAFVAALERP